MRVYIYTIILLTVGCTTQKFDVGTCYPVGLNTRSSHEELIQKMVSKYYNKNETIYAIEEFSPTFNSVIVFSDRNREKSFKLNYRNGRIDYFNELERDVIDQISIRDLENVIKVDNKKEINISKFSSCILYKFVHHKLNYNISRIDYRMRGDLVIKSNLKAISEILESFDDKRKACW